MIDPLLDFYQRELSFIRELGSEFSQKHPKIAGRLRMDADTVEDPHVSRLIEAFALLTARTRLKIEDEFPEICQSMLQALYPQYIAPIPPVSICQFELSESARENAAGVPIARRSRLEISDIQDFSCRFRTCFPTLLFPISVDQIQYIQPPLPLPTSPWNQEVQSAIRMTMSSQSNKLQLSQMQVENLRIFVGGSVACSNQLFEAIHRDCLGMALYSKELNRIEFLPKSSIQPVGFEEDESLVDNDPRTLPAYRLLWEFFAASVKFKFIDVNLTGLLEQFEGAPNVELVFFFKRFHSVCQREVDGQTLRLGCTPIINLFFQRAEPIRLTEAATEYRVIPSARAPGSLEIYSIDRVSAISPSGEETEFRPFFMPSHPTPRGQPERYWHATRRAAPTAEFETDHGSELYLTLVDLDGQRLPADKWTLDIETTCLNRDMVSKLPYGGGQPNIKLVEGSGAVRASLITPPTPTLRPVGADDTHWRLISHLSLHHLSITEENTGAESLREILRLYNAFDNPESRKAVESIRSVKYSRGVARVPGSLAPGFCRGLDIEVTVDVDRLFGTGAYLFAMLIDRFFGMYANINSFTRLTVRPETGQEPLYVGPPRMGGMRLL